MERVVELLNLKRILVHSRFEVQEKYFNTFYEILFNSRLSFNIISRTLIRNLTYLNET